MLARGGLCRSAASTARARFLHLHLHPRNAASLPALRAVFRAYSSAVAARRSYATATSATTPTPTVKRAVKAKAAAKSPPKKKAATKAAATKTKPKSKPKTATKSRAKAAPRAKPAAKKVPKKREVLTPEQKERAALSKEKAKRSELRAAVLSPPPAAPLHAFNVFIAEQTKGKVPEGSSDTAVESMKNATQKWKNITPAEHEHYNHLAREQTAARKAAYNAWLHSHTPQEIAAANKARAQLRRMLKTGSRKPTNTAKLVDDRHVKKRQPAYVFFFAERRSSGDFKGISAQESGTLIGQEWQALSAAERKKYEDESAADGERHAREKAAQA